MSESRYSLDNCGDVVYGYVGEGADMRAYEDGLLTAEQIAERQANTAKTLGDRCVFMCEVSSSSDEGGLELDTEDDIEGDVCRTTVEVSMGQLALDLNSLGGTIGYHYESLGGSEIMETGKHDTLQGLDSGDFPSGTPWWVKY